MKPFTFHQFMAMALLSVAACQPAQAARLAEANSKNVLFYKIAGVPSGTAGQAAWVGPLSMASNGYSIQRGATPISHPERLGVVPALDPGANPTESAALTRATAYFSQNYPLIRGSVQAWLRQQGLPQAWVSYTQPIQIRTNLGTEGRIISWSAYLGAQGDGITPVPKLLLQDGPKTVQITYTPKAADSAVGASGYGPTAGLLSWRVIDAQGTPLTGAMTVDTGGAFDEPEPENTEIDPDHMVKCLIDTTKTGPAWQNSAAAGATDVACPTVAGFTDIRTLLSDYGAQFAVLDYARRYSPVYCREDDGPCLAGEAPPDPNLAPDPNGALAFVPLTFYDYTARSVTYADCGIATYHNEGSYGGVVSLTTDRYAVLPDGTYQAVNQATSTQNMPPQSFTWDLKPPATFRTAADLAGYVIHPGTGAELIPTESLYSYGPMPDIVETNQPSSNSGMRYTNAAQRNGGTGLNITLETECAGGGTYSVGYGWSAADGSFYGAPVEVTRGTPGSVVHSTYARNNPGLRGDTELYYDGDQRLYLQNSANVTDGQAYDISSGGWTTAPGLQNNCGVAGVAYSVNGLPYLACAIPVGAANCPAGWHAGATADAPCERDDPSHQDLFWVDLK